MNDFTRLAENIYLYEPPSPPSPSSTLIILCTWLGGATPRRIAKYTSGYQTHYPGASILLLTTTVYNFAFQPLDAVYAGLSTARETIVRFLDSPSDSTSDGGNTEERKILLHFLSHGGGSVAVQLAHSLANTNTEAYAAFTNALKLIVLDCCPGDDSFLRYYNAAAVSLPRTALAQSIGRAMLYPAIGAIVGLQKARLMRNIPQLKKDLNSRRTFGAKARRLYVYSKGDEMIPWQETERHMTEARSKGLEASGARFEEGIHCALVLADEERYWQAIRGAWEGKEGSWEVMGSATAQSRL